MRVGDHVPELVQGVVEVVHPATLSCVDGESLVLRVETDYHEAIFLGKIFQRSFMPIAIDWHWDKSHALSRLHLHIYRFYKW